jgi:hypothetical protein
MLNHAIGCFRKPHFLRLCRMRTKQALLAARSRRPFRTRIDNCCSRSKRNLDVLKPQGQNARSDLDFPNSSRQHVRSKLEVPDSFRQDVRYSAFKVAKRSELFETCCLTKDLMDIPRLLPVGHGPLRMLLPVRC